MAKFINSQDSISSSLLLWSSRPTQVSIEENYDLKVWPVTNIFNQDGPINFNIPAQSHGMMSEIHVITKVKVQKDGQDLAEGAKNMSVINNFSNSLWGQLDVQIGARTDITQSMRNAYAYTSYFNHILNSESSRRDYLYYNENFLMDQGYTKDEEQLERQFWTWNENIEDNLTALMKEDMNESEKEAALENAKEALWNIDFAKQSTINAVVEALGHTEMRDIKRIAANAWDLFDIAWLPCKVNKAASERSRRLNRGQSITLCSKLHCPLFNTSKCLPTNIDIRVSLTKNSDDFLLLCDSDRAPFSVVIEDCYLQVSYYRPRDSILGLIENKLNAVPAPYFITRPEILVKPIQNSGRMIRITDIFHDKMPAFAFFCLQESKSFEGRKTCNPYCFIPFKSFQFYLDGSPYFKEPLEVKFVERGAYGTVRYEDFGDYMRQLYKTMGKSLKGDCLVNSKNFLLNFMVGLSFGADKSSLAENHLNLQTKSSSYLEIDMGLNTDIPADMVLIVYAVHDRQIQIDKDRQITIVE